MTDHLVVADVLDTAADYIERHGLARGRSWVGESACSVAACNEGARILLGRDTPWSATADSAIAALVASVGFSDFVAWSDNSPNDQVVLDAFRLAAKNERRLADGLA